MGRIYFYKMIVDNGGAPCIQDGFLSLAICKPRIRCSGDVGDLIFGFAANSMHADNRLIYAARITATIRNGEYFRDRKWRDRRDCIYEWRRDRFEWRPGALYHGPKNLGHDLGHPPVYDRAHVLLSHDFRYLGAKEDSSYKDRFPLIKQAVELLAIGERINHPEGLRREFLELAQQLWAETPDVTAEESSNDREQQCNEDRGDSEK